MFLHKKWEILLYASIIYNYFQFIDTQSDIIISRLTEAAVGSCMCRGYTLFP